MTTQWFDIRSAMKEAKRRTDTCDEYITLADHQAALAEARGQAIQDFIHGRTKLCLVCGGKEPCELKDDLHSPCTFEPTPMELMVEVTQTRNAILSFGLEVMASCPEYTEAFKIGGIMAVLQNLMKNKKSILAQAIRFAEWCVNSGMNPALRAEAKAFLDQHHPSCLPSGYTDCDGCPHPPECHPDCQKGASHE